MATTPKWTAPEADAFALALAEKCGQLQAERDALLALVRAWSGIGAPKFGEPGHRDFNQCYIDSKALLARLDGRTP